MSDHADRGTSLPRSLDWTLVIAVACMASFGLLMILSASSLDADARYGNALHFVSKQLVGLVAGVVAAGLVLVAPWSWLRRSIYPGYALSLVGLAMVLTPLGITANGATRWIDVGPVNFQPSELAKLTCILAMGHFLACNEGRLRDTAGVVLPALALVFPAVALIVAQRDLGTTVIVVGLVGVLLFVAGLQWRWVVGFASGALAAMAMLVVVEPYRMRRLISFLDPFADPDGAGYQVVQGWIALATGGLTGTGLASGVAQRGFLPEAHTDFIIAVIGEELGAVGWSLTVLLAAIICWRGTAIAAGAKDLFGMLVASGITAMFAAQAIVNVGVVGGVLPAKGLVFPFLSYGASAAVVHVLCVGVLLRIGVESAAAAPRTASTTAVTELGGAPA